MNEKQNQNTEQINKKEVINDGVKEQKTYRVGLRLDEGTVQHASNYYKTRVLELIEFFDDEDIAKITGISLTTVRRIIKNAGINRATLQQNPCVVIWLPRELQGKVDTISLKMIKTS